MRSILLIIDAIVNIFLGFFLVFFPLKVVDLLGLPVETPPFYAIVLGGVLIGIGIALFLGTERRSGTADGLGLGGALLINLFAALALVSLLIGDRIYIPLRGYLILLGLVLFLLLLCGVELLVYRAGRGQSSGEEDE